MLPGQFDGAFSPTTWVSLSEDRNFNHILGSLHTNQNIIPHTTASADAQDQAAAAGAAVANLAFVSLDRDERDRQ